MSAYMLPLFSGIPVDEFRYQLRQRPDVWNRHRERTIPVGGPHKDVDDVWFRYASQDLPEPPEVICKTMHESVWYQAAHDIPALRPIVDAVMHLTGGLELGGVLMTRIPPGKKVEWHCDDGWHAQYYDKFAIQIEGHQQQWFMFPDGAFSAAPGDLYWFNNQAPHCVINDSPVDRITLIVCVRLARTPDTIALKGY